MAKKQVKEITLSQVSEFLSKQDYYTLILLGKKIEMTIRQQEKDAREKINLRDVLLVSAKNQFGYVTSRNERNCTIMLEDGNLFPLPHPIALEKIKELNDHPTCYGNLPVYGE